MPAVPSPPQKIFTHVAVVSVIDDAVVVLASLPIVPGAKKPRPYLFAHVDGRIPMAECSARLRYLVEGPQKPKPPTPPKPVVM